MEKLDLTGQVYGRLTVIEEAERRNQKRYWRCRCECGNETAVLQQSLRRGQTQSCGCLHNEMIGAQRATHNRTRTPEFNAWVNMRLRCNNPNNTSYPNYGGRGIRVCQRWANDFAAFLEDMGERPSPRHTLERADNSKDYSPENCRWATWEEQGRNKRNNHYLTHDQETLTIAEWSERTGIPQKVLRRRVNQLKWPTAKALTTPCKSMK